ncbi:adenylate/guanylate cyclase domain-containing protein, partial [Aduncisulcus paluster]
MDGKQYPSLALATLMKAMGRKNIIAKTSPIGIESIRVGKTTIPVDAKGQMLVRYRGGMEEFPYYSAMDILSGKVGEKNSRVKSVTPFASDYPGVEVHATIVDNILTRDFLLKPDWVPGLELLLVLAAGIISMILLTWSRSMWMILPIAVMGAGIVYGSLHVFREYNAYLTPMYALIAL